MAIRQCGGRERYVLAAVSSVIYSVHVHAGCLAPLVAIMSAGPRNMTDVLNLAFALDAEAIAGASEGKSP